MKFDVFSLESGYDFLDIGVGTFDGHYLYRFTGTYSIQNQGIADASVSASKTLSDTFQEPESDGRKKRSVTSDFCSASTSYYDYGSFPYVIHLNSTKIWLKMTTDSSIVFEGFVLQLISTRFEVSLSINYRDLHHAVYVCIYIYIYIYTKMQEIHVIVIQFLPGQSTVSFCICVFFSYSKQNSSFPFSYIYIYNIYIYIYESARILNSDMTTVPRPFSSRLYIYIYIYIYMCVCVCV